MLIRLPVSTKCWPTGCTIDMWEENNLDLCISLVQTGTFKLSSGSCTVNIFSVHCFLTKLMPEYICFSLLCHKLLAFSGWTYPSLSGAPRPTSLGSSRVEDSSISAGSSIWERKRRPSELGLILMDIPAPSPLRPNEDTLRELNHGVDCLDGKSESSHWHLHWVSVHTLAWTLRPWGIMIGKVIMGNKTYGSLPAPLSPLGKVRSHG